MEAIQSNFFNEDTNPRRKQEWIKWSRAMASKENDGLGVRSFFALNMTLLFKWIWRFVTQKSSLWSKVINSLYGVDGMIGYPIRNKKGSIWLNIVSEMSNLRQQRLYVTSFMHREIGNGEETMFWDDLWQGEQRFREKYHQLYALENCKGITVASKLSLITFDYSFRRKRRGGVEEYQFLEIVNELKEVTLSNKNDRWNWQLEDLGEFTVASLLAIIDD